MDHQSLEAETSHVKLSDVTDYDFSPSHFVMGGLHTQRLVKTCMKEFILHSASRLKTLNAHVYLIFNKSPPPKKKEKRKRKVKSNNLTSDKTSKETCWNFFS